MTERPVRVGVVGADPSGRGFAPRAHIPAILATRGLELFAVCTAHEETARKAAEQWGAKRWYSDPEAMCADPDIDLITVSVRVRLHRQVVEAAIAQRKTVYCEWPLGLDTEDAAAMAKMATESAVTTGVGTQGRFSPAVRLLKEALDRGDIGRPLTFEISHQLSRFEVDEDRAWLARREEASGALHVAAGHVTDTLRYVLGDISGLAGLCETVAPKGTYADTGRLFTWTAPDVVAYVCRLASGISGVVHITNVANPAPGFTLRIFGESGLLMISAPGYISFDRPTVWYGKQGERLAELAVPDEYRQDVDLPDDHPGLNVALALLGLVYAASIRQRFSPDFSDAVTLHRILEAIERSSQQGGWERIAS